MSEFELEAIVAKAEVFESLELPLADLKVVPLEQGFAMIPLVSDDVDDSDDDETDDDEQLDDDSHEIARDGPSDNAAGRDTVNTTIACDADETAREDNDGDDDFMPAHLDASIQKKILELSERGPVAYVSSFICGGRNEDATVWHRGQVIFQNGDDIDAMSQALRVMGAEKGDYYRESIAVGTENRTLTKDWLLSDEEWLRVRARRMEEDDAAQAEALLAIQYKSTLSRRKWWQFWR